MSFAITQQNYFEELKDITKSAWRLFFPEEELYGGHPEKNELERFRIFFNNTIEEKQIVYEKREYYLDYLKLRTQIDKQGISFENLIKQNAERTLKIASAALTIVCNTENKNFKKTKTEFYIEEEIKRIDLRVSNVLPIISLREIKAKNLGCLVSIYGTVVKVNSVRPEIQKNSSICVKCSNICVVYYKKGKVEMPKKCPKNKCNSKIFNFESLPSVIGYHAVQEITIQEIFGTEEGGGRVPRTVLCYLSGSLTGAAAPGDVIRVSGIIETQETSERTTNTAIQELYLNANSLINESAVEERNTLEENETVFSAEEAFEMNEISKIPNIFGTLISSFCPSVYGHELVKLGILLSLFGGTNRQNTNNGGSSVRSESHVLMVGDPGIGKSQLLCGTARIAPRAVYVCGNATSVAGLTVSIKNGGLGEYTIEAGALVLADRGVCLIDELDKMSSERHSGLLETMEQQSVSIAKAGISCTLPARTAVIAAANPARGDYNTAKKGRDIVRMNKALLSRFDLVFLMRDVPDKKHDEKISEHIIGRRMKNKKTKLEEVSLTQRNIERGSLLERIRFGCETIEMATLKKYILYSRQKIQPKLTEEAADLLKEYYLDMRQRSLSGTILSITVRQLESLIRLSEGRAKMELRNVVTEQDAEDVIELMESCYSSTFIENTGSDHRKKKTKTTKRQEVISFLRNELRKGISEHTREKLLSIKGVEKEVAEETIEMLMECGALLIKPGGILRFIETNS